MGSFLTFVEESIACSADDLYPTLAKTRVVDPEC